MKAKMIGALAGAAMMVAGAADAATYNITYTPAIFSYNVPTFSALADVDYATHTVTSFDVLGYGETISSISWTGDVVTILGNYMGSAVLTMNMASGTFSLFSSTFSYAALGYINPVEISAVPLPATLPLLAGALGVAGLAKRRRKSV